MSELLYQTLRESVVNAIRTKIMNHQIRPGERIVEMELAHEFQTSRGPIREALRQLENEGIVEYTRNVGCSVRTFSFWDSYEVYLLRTNYEAVSVRFLNGKIPGETIQKMEEILERMRKIPTEEFESVFEYDNCFHEQLVLMSGLPRLAKAWKELYYGNLLAGYELINEKEKILAHQYDNHIAILKACKEGNPEKICDEVKKHYWKTIFCMMQEEKIKDPDLEQAWKNYIRQSKKKSKLPDIREKYPGNGSMMISVIRSKEKKTERIWYFPNLRKMWYLSIILLFLMITLIWEF